MSPIIAPNINFNNPLLTFLAFFYKDFKIAVFIFVYIGFKCFLKHRLQFFAHGIVNSIFHIYLLIFYTPRIQRGREIFIVCIIIRKIGIKPDLCLKTAKPKSSSFVRKVTSIFLYKFDIGRIFKIFSE